MASSVEIIDLTSPKIKVYEILDSDSEKLEGDSLRPSSTQDARKERKRNRRGRRSSLNPNTGNKDSAESQGESRVLNSERSPGVRTKRKRRDESPSGNTEHLSRREHRETDIQEEWERFKERQQQDESTEELFPFSIDLAPAPIPSSIVSAVIEPLEKAKEEETAAKLLVPSHVTVLGSTPIEIIKPLEDDEDIKDFISYLDYDDSKHMTRYYDEPADESAILTRTVCKKCGAEGEHKTSACTVQICLTCGLRNEHSTRSCPISKVCFTCGMKGHINANCPNRRTARALQSSREMECDRCSSSYHKTNECPTVWRMYEYLTSDEQKHIVAIRQSKKDLKLGKGGEGYVADDEWCYYCGQCGHWGDDCEDMERPPDEHSAFSKYNVMMGPFYDPGNQRKASTSRSRVRDWENKEDTTGWDKNAPGPVGRQGRIKSRAALEKQAQAAVEDDQDDWFGNAGRNANKSSNRGQRRDKEKEPSKTFTFGKSMGSGRQYAPPPADTGRPSLLARLGEEVRDDRDSSRYSSRRSHKRDYKDDRDSSTRRRRDRDRDDKSSSSHYSDRRRYDSGPRYKGGYAR